MTFLELCGKVATFGGGVGRAPATVVDQTGRLAQVVEFTAEAWRLVQLSKANWFFMKGEWQGTMTIADTTYAAGDAGWTIPRFGEWIGDYSRHRPTTIYDPAIGRADENQIRQISWERWKRSYDVGVHNALRPYHYAIAPDGSIRFGPKPDKAYVARGEYRMAPQVLAADADSPAMPARFHMVIVYRAIMLMAEHDMRVSALATAQRKYGEMIGSMQRDLLPSFNVRAERPLA